VKGQQAKAGNVNHGVAAACASGNYALAQARRWLELGWVDVCLAGACDAGVTGLGLAGFGNLRALSRRNDQPQAASRPFDRDRDGLTLQWLADVPVPEAQKYLTSLPGVGRKTAACVLLFALGMRDVPVDTHVARVGTRLGLFRPGAGFEELHDTMLALTPPGAELELHLNLLRHGRRTCYARRPDCGGCALERICPKVGVAG